MPPAERPRVGYVLKMYPRLSETFIVTEILAHERARLDIDIFSLRSPIDGRFHGALGQVRAGVTWVPQTGSKGSDFWALTRRTAERFPGTWSELEAAVQDDQTDVYQAMLVAHAAADRGLSHLHAHFATTATHVARLASRLAGITYSFTAHAKDIFHESVDHSVLRRNLRDAAAVITVSDFNLEFLRSTFGDAAERVHRIYNGLDLAEFALRPYADRPPLILGVGRLVEKKGFGDLIDACELLAARGRAFQCEIVGSGELEAPLRSRIRARGLDHLVTMTGAMTRDEVIERIAKSAVVAAPCVVGEDGNRDGLPTVILEAMALGTPCVATDVTGIPELVRDGETGLITPQRDPATLASALERLLDDRDLGRRLATRGRRLMEQEFDIHRNTAAMRARFGAPRDAGSRQAVGVV